MDPSVWQWRSPWEKRTYIFCSLFLFLCLQQATAVETGYSQDSKSDVTDSNKLDSFSSYVPYDSREFEAEYKRGSAFFPLRGKKPSDDDSEDDKRSQFFPLRGKKVPDDLKRASYFMPMRGRRDGSWADEDYDITDESPDKRASSFMPMRGKKKYAAISDFLTKAGTYDTGALNPSSYRKRMHSFVPVRGKRSSEDPPSGDQSTNHTAQKRSVSFMPMRGRREEAETPISGIVTSLLEKKMQAFMPMRGRKDGNEEFGDVDKKATFMPMRGRKDGSELGVGFDDIDKKAKFMPMRGRKDEEYEEPEESKRAQSFMPMRGRRAQLRDVVFESSNAPGIESRLIEDKRASSFMPMRGRRSVPEDEDVPEYEEDVDKRVAFMPMRGRRLSEDDNVEVEPWPADQLVSLLDKKSSAFMPMRGRRYDYRNITVDPWQADQLMSLFDNKRSSAFMPMRGRRFSDDDDYYYRNITVDPWQADQLMSLFDNKRSSTFMPMRGRRDYDEPWDKRGSSFTPMRGRRFDSLLGRSFYSPYPYLMAGMGSSLMSKPYSDQGVSYQSVGSAAERRKKLRINWDSVKRAFHATRGKRRDSDPSESDPASSGDSESPARTKRSIMRQRISLQPSRQYIALKRPMSFFATRGKRLDDSTLDKLSKLR